MAPKAVRVKSIASIVANAITAENILSFKEDHVHNMTAQFMPNVPQGVDVLQKAKFRRLTLVLDSDSNIFDLNFKVAADNVFIGTTIVVTFDMAIAATAAAISESWTYITDKSWITKKEFGRIEDGVKRSTFEYQIICYGTKVIA